MSKLVRIALISGMTIAGNAYADIEIELVGGQSSKKLADDEEGSNSYSVKSNDIGLSVAYQYKDWFSIGLATAYKHFDFTESAKDLKTLSDLTYAQIEAQSGIAASVSKETPSGYSKGLVYGPQISFVYPGKFFQPYLRLAYLMGTLDTVAEYKTTATFNSLPMTYDIKVSEKRKTTFSQYGIGFRIPFGKSVYAFADASAEAMSYTTGSSTLSTKVDVNGQSDSTEYVDSDSVKDSGGGTVIKLGLGLSL